MRLCRVAQVVIEILLNAGHADDLCRPDPFLAKTGASQHMRGQLTVGIKTHVTRRKKQPRIADFMNGLHLLGTDLALDPQELALACEIFEQIRRVEIRKHLGEFLRCVRGVNHLGGLRIKRMGFEIRRQKVPMTIHDIGARGMNLRTGRPHPRLDRFGGRQHPHPQPHNPKSNNEKQPQHQQPPLCPLARLIAHLLVTDTDVFAFNGIGVFASVARVENAGKWAQRRADHCSASAVVSVRLASSTISLISTRGSGG